MTGDRRSAEPWAAALGVPRTDFARPDDPALAPAFELLDAAFWEERFGSAGRTAPRATIRSVRYKPAHSLRVALTLEGPDGVVPLAAEATRDPADAARALRKARRKRLVAGAAVPPAGTLIGGRAFFHLAWNDPQLPGLTLLTRPERLARALEADLLSPRERVRAHRLEVVPVKYRPERAALARIVLRTRRTHDGDRVRRRLAAKAEAKPLDPRRLAWEENAARRCPTLAPPFGSLDRPRLRLWAWREGEPLEQLLEVDPTAASDGVERAGRALRTFHETAPAPPERGTADPVSAAAETLALADADLGRRAASLAASLRRALGTAASCAIHGDFHARQILAAGDEMTLLDLDRAARADPHLDLGSFLARLPPAPRSLADAFLEGYGRHDPRRLLWALARAHVLLSVRPLRNLEPDWREGARTHLERAATLLADLGV